MSASNCPTCGGAGQLSKLTITNLVHVRGVGFEFTIEGICQTCNGAGTVEWVPVDVNALRTPSEGSQG